jgi:uncharacterized protein (TIGR02646 family)
MRCIPFDQLQMPDGWAEDAEAARQAVAEARQAFEEARAAGAEAPQPTCSAVINGNAVIWRNFKEHLAALSHNKCWYCETRRVRDDFAVDHFRPKAAAKSDNHEGYWWLAFDYRNFRFSCLYCNEVRVDRETDQSGGKGSAFPLLDGGRRACKPDDDLADERCALLDPIEPHDAELIGFTDDGSAVPEADPDLEVDEYERAEISIALYHLNHGRLLKRRAQLASIVASKIAQAEQQFRVYRRRRQEEIFPGVIDAKERFKQLRDELRELKQECREYSALVGAIIVAAQCPERPWVRRLLG